MNLCPTTPVAPRIPIGSLSLIKKVLSILQQPLFAEGYRAQDRQQGRIWRKPKRQSPYELAWKLVFRHCGAVLLPPMENVEEHHARTATEFLYQGVGHHRYRAGAASGR